MMRMSKNGQKPYQQMLIAGRDRDRCFQAFLNNHYVGLVIFVGVTVEYL